MLSRVGPWNYVLFGVQLPPREEALFMSGKLKSIIKRRILGVSKRVSCAKMDGLILTVCMSYDIFLQKEVPFGGRDEAAPHLRVKFPKTPFFGRQ